MNSLSLPTFSPWKKKIQQSDWSTKKKLKIWNDEIFFFWSSNLKNQTWLNKIIKQHQLIHKAKKKHKKIELDGKTKWVLKNLKPGFWKWIERGGWCPLGFFFPRYQNQTCKGEREELFLLQVIKWERLIKETHWLDRLDSQLWFIAHW